MAKEEEKKEGAEEAEAPAEKKSSNMLLIIIIVVLFLIIIVGGVVAFFLMSGDDEAQQAPAPKEEKSAKKHKSVTHSNGQQMDDSRALSDIGTLYPLDTFTVNLKSDSGRRYLKVTLSLELSGPELSAELDAKTAVLRDRIIRILTSKTLQEISSRKGKEKVSQQIMNKLNAMLTDGEIKGVYFTEFVIQ